MTITIPMRVINTFAKIQNGAKTMILKTNLILNEP